MITERNTMQKQIIRRVVHELGNHPSAEQVYQRVVVEYPNISKATVYRNLSQMARAGELKNAGNFAGVTHYDHQCHEHYHFICSKCGRIYDVDACGDLARMFSVPEGFDMQNYTLSFEGVCKECNQKRSKLSWLTKIRKSPKS